MPELYRGTAMKLDWKWFVSIGITIALLVLIYILPIVFWIGFLIGFCVGVVVIVFYGTPIIAILELLDIKTNTQVQNYVNNRINTKKGK